VKTVSPIVNPAPPAKVTDMVTNAKAVQPLNALLPIVILVPAIAFTCDITTLPSDVHPANALSLIVVTLRNAALPDSSNDPIFVHPWNA